MATINIDTYMAANPLLTFTDALQACVDLKRPLLLPSQVARRYITKPILIEGPFIIRGEYGLQHSIGESSNITAIDLNGRPMFIVGYRDGTGFHGIYLDSDGIYRVVSDATDYTTSFTTDTATDAAVLYPMVIAQYVQAEDMWFDSFDSYGSIFNLSGAYGCKFISCTLHYSNVGLLFGTCFLTRIDHCEFHGHTPSWLPVDAGVVSRFKAGTASAGDLVIIAEKEARIKRAYALYLAGNCVVTNCRIVQSSTGLVLNGQGSNVINVAIEKCHLGLALGGYPQLDIATLSTQLDTGPYATKITWGMIGSNITGIEMESCRQGIEFGIVGAGCTLKSMTVIGSNARQLDETNGLCDYGIKVLSISGDVEYSQIQSVVNDTAPEPRYRVIGDLDVNETLASRAKIKNLEAEDIVLQQTKADDVKLRNVTADLYNTNQILATKTDIESLNQAIAEQGKS